MLDPLSPSRKPADPTSPPSAPPSAAPSAPPSPLRSPPPPPPRPPAALDLPPSRSRRPRTAGVGLRQSESTPACGRPCSAQLRLEKALRRGEEVQAAHARERERQLAAQRARVRREEEEELRQRAAVKKLPWWQRKRKDRLVAKYSLWLDEALSDEGLVTTLPQPGQGDQMVSASGGSLLGQAEGVLQARVDDYQALVLRIRRFALQGALPADHPHAGKNLLRQEVEHTSDACPTVLVNMLLSLRVCATLVVEAVAECERQQREDTHVNLNLPFVKHACEAITREIDRDRELARGRSHQEKEEPRHGRSVMRTLHYLKSSRDLTPKDIPPVEEMPIKPGPGFEKFSKDRHLELLRSLPDQLSFMPIPFHEDPLMLKWFDDHSGLWRSSLSMNPERMSVCVYTRNDLRRMLNAQSAILRAINQHRAAAMNLIMPASSSTPRERRSSSVRYSLRRSSCHAGPGIRPIFYDPTETPVEEPLAACPPLPASKRSTILTRTASIDESRMLAPACAVPVRESLSEQPPTLDLDLEEQSATRPAATSAASRRSRVSRDDARRSSSLASPDNGATDAIRRETVAKTAHLATQLEALNPNYVVAPSPARAAVQLHMKEWTQEGYERAKSPFLWAPEAAYVTHARLGPREAPRLTARRVDELASPRQKRRPVATAPRPASAPAGGAAAAAKAKAEGGEALTQEQRYAVGERARQVWKALEMYIYGGVGKYAQALDSLDKQMEVTAATTMQSACRAFMGRRVTEAQKLQLAAVVIQRHYRKHDNTRRREKHYRQETLTAAVLLRVHTRHAAFGSRHSEVQKLQRRVASERIKMWLQSDTFITRRRLRRAAITQMQNIWRAGIARRRMTRLADYRHEQTVSLTVRMLATASTTVGSECAVSVIVKKFRQYLNSCKEKLAFFDEKVWKRSYLIGADLGLFPFPARYLSRCIYIEHKRALSQRRLGISAGCVAPIREETPPETEPEVTAWKPADSAVVAALARAFTKDKSVKLLTTRESGSSQQLLSRGGSVASVKERRPAAGSMDTLSIEEEAQSRAQIERRFREAVVLVAGVQSSQAAQVSEWMQRVRSRVQLDGAIEVLDHLKEKESALASRSLLANATPSAVLFTKLVLQQERGHLGDLPSINSIPSIDEPEDVELPMMASVEELRLQFSEMKEWYSSSAALAITRSFHAQRYQIQLKNLHLERQEALKPLMMLKYRTELKAAIRQRKTIEICLAHIDKLKEFKPLTTIHSRVEMLLTLDDWKHSSPPIEFPEAARHSFLDELRDWYSIPRALKLSLQDVHSPSPFKFTCQLQIDTPMRDGVEKGDGLGPADPEMLSQIQNLLDTFQHTPEGKIEMKRFPDTARMLGMKHIGIEILGCMMTSTTVNEEPTLAERIPAAHLLAEAKQAEVSNLANLRLNRASRKWYYLHGAISWLKGERILPEIDDSSMMSSKAVASLRWEMLRELMRMDQSHSLHRARKHRYDTALRELMEARAEERVARMLLDELKHSIEPLPVPQIRSTGAEVQMVDVDYNWALWDPATGQPEGYTNSNAPGQVCYFCAGGFRLEAGSPVRGVRALHPLSRCPRRKVEGVRDFLPRHLEAVRAKLKREAEGLKLLIGEHEATAVAAKQRKVESYTIAGTCRMIDELLGRCTPCRSEPPDRAALVEMRSSFRQRALHASLHELHLWRRTLVRDLAKACRIHSRVNSNHLSDFKGQAVLQHQWDHTLRNEDNADDDVFILTPELLISAAVRIGIRFGLDDSVPKQGPVRAMWVAAEFAKAPLPAFWSVSTANGKVVYRRTEGTSITETEVHPLRDVYSRVAERYIARQRQADVPLNRNPQLPWYLFNQNGKLEFCRLCFSSVGTPFRTLKVIDQPSQPYFEGGKPRVMRTSNVSFSRLPPQDPVAQRQTKLAQEAVAAMLQSPSLDATAPPPTSPLGDKERFLPSLLQKLAPIIQSLEVQRIASISENLRPLELLLHAADAIGVPYGGKIGSAMLWIADASLCPVLPLGWHEWESTEKEHPASYQSVCYYQQVLTGETTWEHPQISFLRGVAAAVNDAIRENQNRQIAAIMVRGNSSGKLKTHNSAKRDSLSLSASTKRDSLSLSASAKRDSLSLSASAQHDSLNLSTSSKHDSLSLSTSSKHDSLSLSASVKRDVILSSNSMDGAQSTKLTGSTSALPGKIWT